MSRQDANAAFALSSFLQGTNAPYIDDLYARYEKDPNSVDADWQAFFKSLKDAPADAQKNADGPSWGRDNWPLTPRDDRAPVSLFNKTGSDPGTHADIGGVRCGDQRVAYATIVRWNETDDALRHRLVAAMQAIGAAMRAHIGTQHGG